MSNKQFLALPYGKDDFTKLRAQDCYFVDKTPYIKQVFGVDSSDVLLLTRPRRFGKTLLMSMFDSFLKINPEKPFDNSKQLELFKGTKILEDKEFCDKFMGQCPVIAVSLKDMEADTFEEAYKMFADIVWDVSKRYFYLLNSNKLDESDKVILRQLTDINYLEDINNSQRVKNSLKHLSSFLYKEYEKYPILLIDEYDVPLANASYHDIQNTKLYGDDKEFKADYHSRMVTLMKGFLGILKDKNALTKTIITGCLKVAKNSIFTGVNNLKVNTVTSQNLALTGIIGFTKEETLKALKDYEMDEYAELVKNSYDGYRFCDKEMFCPWDVINFIDENYKNNLSGHKELVKANNYWAATTSGHAVYEYLGFLTDTDTQKMQDLIDGKSVSFSLNDSMNYDNLSEHNPDDFWSLLLHTGYLTVDWDKTTEELKKANTSSKNIFARIPNLEIRECFTQNIQQKFKEQLSKDNTASTLVNSFLDGKAQEASDILFDLLQHYVSVRDTATKAPHENYYHGFLNGLFSNCKDIITDYHSNYESGDGYADITFKSRRNSIAVVIEIKAVTREEDLDEYAQRALEQIEEKNYCAPFLKISRVKNILAFGIAFGGKDCAVAFRNVK